MLEDDSKKLNQEPYGRKLAPAGHRENRTSAKQVAANRRNATRSTGPRTPEGKKVSKFNAVKHGLRAAEIVIPGQEDPRQFEALFQEVLDEWMPQGPTELALVNQIATCQWRLRRARRAELGEIRRGILNATAHDPGAEIIHARPFSPPAEVFKKSAKGLAMLKSPIEAAMDHLENEGTVSEETCEALDELFGEGATSPAWMLRILLHQEPSDRPSESNTPSPQETRRKAAARKHLITFWNDLEGLRRKATLEEKIALEIKLESLSIPNAAQRELLQRYETNIMREMKRAIELLEHLQRRRRGEPLPPTLNLNISGRDV